MALQTLLMIVQVPFALIGFAVVTLGIIAALLDEGTGLGPREKIG